LNQLTGVETDVPEVFPPQEINHDLMQLEVGGLYSVTAVKAETAWGNWNAGSNIMIWRFDPIFGGGSNKYMDPPPRGIGSTNRIGDRIHVRGIKLRMATHPYRATGGTGPAMVRVIVFHREGPSTTLDTGMFDSVFRVSASTTTGNPIIGADVTAPGHALLDEVFNIEPGRIFTLDRFIETHLNITIDKNTDLVSYGNVWICYGFMGFVSTATYPGVSSVQVYYTSPFRHGEQLQGPLQIAGIKKSAALPLSAAPRHWASQALRKPGARVDDRAPNLKMMNLGRLRMNGKVKFDQDDTWAAFKRWYYHSIFSPDRWHPIVN